MIRLQKALADRGVASRRRAEELIADGRVRVDGVAVTTLGTKVAPDARIDVDGTPTHAASPRYVLLNKPRGIVSTAHDERGRRTVVDLVGAQERLYPVGRLDTDSEGMLLLTNDGEWAQRVIHPRSGHEREYDVAVTGELSPGALAQLKRGVRLDEGLALASRIDVLQRSRRESHLRIVLRTGWRRQIRRMLSAVGLRTVRLVRVRIGSLQLGRLHTGEWRELTSHEIAALSRPDESRPRRETPPTRRAASGAQRGAPPARRDAPPAQQVAPRAQRAAPHPQRAAPRAQRVAPRAQRAAPTDRARTGASVERSRSRTGPMAATRRPGRAPITPRGRDSRRPTSRVTRPRAAVARRRRPAPYGSTRGPVRARVSPT